MIVLDTNVLSELAHRRPNPDVIAWIDSVRAAIAIPFSAVYEIERGICSLRSKDPDRALKLRDWLDALLTSDMPFLPMDATTARIYAEMSLVPDLRDLWVPDHRSRSPKAREDMAIAASAVAYRAAIATLNVSDFQRIHGLYPLPGVYNPAKRQWVVPYDASKQEHLSAAPFQKLRQETTIHCPER